MSVIKFSHDYPKLHGQTSAELLAVRPIRIDRSTPRELLEYDTKYDGGYYKLATGDYIQLIFLGNLRIPFCTIRRNYPPQKGDYYRGKVGDVFTIEVKPEAKGETNEAEEEKPLPCPFCGADGMITELKEGGFRAFCWECLSKSGMYSTKADAIAAWNRRAK